MSKKICSFKLLRGARKGKACGKPAKQGEAFCSAHSKMKNSSNKKGGKNKKKESKNDSKRKAIVISDHEESEYESGDDGVEVLYLKPLSPEMLSDLHSVIDISKDSISKTGKNRANSGSEAEEIDEEEIENSDSDESGEVSAKEEEPQKKPCDPITRLFLESGILGTAYIVEQMSPRFGLKLQGSFQKLPLHPCYEMWMEKFCNEVKEEYIGEDTPLWLQFIFMYGTVAIMTHKENSYLEQSQNAQQGQIYQQQAVSEQQKPAEELPPYMYCNSNPVTLNKE